MSPGLVGPLAGGLVRHRSPSHRAGGKAIAGGKATGGADRDRTGDLRLAKAALYQLSYSPGGVMVGLSGFEPLTSRLSGVRSNQLSYRPVV